MNNIMLSTCFIDAISTKGVEDSNYSLMSISVVELIIKIYIKLDNHKLKYFTIINRLKLHRI